MNRDSDDGGAPGLTRRDLLRRAGLAGAATLIPAALAACQPATPPLLPPDAVLRNRSFVGGPEARLPVGAWCWFQSPRATIGPNGRLWLGTSVDGTDTEIDGSVQLTAFDLGPMKMVDQRTIARTRTDDHTSPSVLAFGSKVQVAWALHQRNDYLDVATYQVGAPFTTRRIRRPGAIQGEGRGMAYASAHVVNGQRWILYRGERFSWNLLTSPDGITWTARGLVVTPPVSGARPYVHATSDGKNLHLLVTDGHPDELRGTGISAGVVAADLTIRNSVGTVIGRVGDTAPKPAAYTRLARGSVGASPGQDVAWWLSDLQFIDGRPTGIISRRDAWPQPGSEQVGLHRHRYYWIRHRAGGWRVEPLAWAGGELGLFTQPDYTGLGAQDPTEPRRVVVSTNVHPTTAVPLRSAVDGLVHWELFEGFRTGEGTWSWTPLTANSTYDNLRPTIPAAGAYKALAWMRGTYWSWTDFGTTITVRKAVATQAAAIRPTATWG